MKKLVLATASLVVALSAMLAFNGCSSDDTSNPNGNNNTSAKIYIEMKSNALTRYNNTDLDSLNNPVPSSTHQYEASMKKGSFIMGAYSDWYYRIGTDKRNGEKDTAYVRTNIGSLNNASFTKEVQMYGFAHQVHAAFVEMITLMNPAITPPSIPGEEWDVIAMYHDQNGTAYDVGKEWTIGPVNGLDLGFSIVGLPVPLNVNVKIKGKLESKAESYMMGTKDVKAWKTTMYVTLTSSLFKVPVVIKISFWFSDDPDTMVKGQQESVTIEFIDLLKPFLGNGVNIPGFKSEAYEYAE